MYGPFGSIINGSRTEPAAPPALREGQVLELRPAPTGTAAPLSVGIPNASEGLASNPAISSINVLLATPRTRWVSAVGAGASCGHRSGQFLWTRLTGFRLRARFGLINPPANGRGFVGLRGATAAFGAINPSAALLTLGMAYDPGQATWRIMHNDLAGAATQVDLGASFPVADNSLLELELDAYTDPAAVHWRAANLITGIVAEGDITADLPPATGASSLLSSYAWGNTNDNAVSPYTLDVAFIASEGGPRA